MTSAHEALGVLLAARLSLAVAEGDTGGALLSSLTAVPGSSRVVVGGVVAYHDDLKRGILGVEPSLIERHGAVSAQVARAMAAGVRRLARADLGVATTGIAGPGGATAEKPVGLAYVAAADGERELVREHHWHGDRASNRQQSAEAALSLLIELVQKIETT